MMSNEIIHLEQERKNKGRANNEGDRIVHTIYVHVHVHVLLLRVHHYTIT